MFKFCKNKSTKFITYFYCDHKKVIIFKLKIIVNYAKKFNCKKFIFFSTTSIEYEENNKEKKQYIRSKKKAEEYFKNKGIKVISLRLPSILSPNLNNSLWFSKLSRKSSAKLFAFEVSSSKFAPAKISFSDSNFKNFGNDF